MLARVLSFIMQNLVCGLPDRDRHEWHGWTTRATRSRSTFADEGDYFRLDPFVTGQYLPTHFLAVAAITAATITAKQTARQPREGGVNMMDNTDNATALPNVCSWFLQLSDCSCRLQSTCANGFPAPVNWWIRRSLTPEWTRSTTVMPSLTLPSLTMH